MRTRCIQVSDLVAESESLETTPTSGRPSDLSLNLFMFAFEISGREERRRTPLAAVAVGFDRRSLKTEHKWRRAASASAAIQFRFSCPFFFALELAGQSRSDSIRRGGHCSGQNNDSNTCANLESRARVLAQAEVRVRPTRAHQIQIRGVCVGRKWAGVGLEVKCAGAHVATRRSDGIQATRPSN